MIGPVLPPGMQPVERNGRIQPVIPYTPLPYRDESRPYAYGYGARRPLPARAAADAAAEWAAAVRDARDKLRSLLDYRTSAWQERVVLCEDGAVRGTAARGATLRTYTVEVVRLARSQLNRGFELAAGAGSVAEAGKHAFVIDVGGTATLLAVEVGSADSNERMLTKIRDAVNGAGAGVTAALARDKSAGTAALLLAAGRTGTAGAFAVADADGGSAVAAAGFGAVLEEAADAVYRVDGHAPVSAAGNGLTLDAGKVRLVLSGLTDGPVVVQVTADTAAVAAQTSDVVDALSRLAVLHDVHAEHLDPALPARLEHAMGAGGIDALGLRRAASGGWALDRAQLEAAIAAEPEGVRRRLAGPLGWAAAVERELERFGSLPMEALLNPASPVMTVSAVYRADAALYWQLPRSGWLYNRES